ncbi:MAG: GNAT family N-acetyltransferase [Paracoccaceae bacterium]|nr:GNAT family N-acetyltransferase [Paracoccaceae bacterium]
MSKIIKTERLLLRPLEIADAPELARLIADWQVMRWLTSPPWPYRVEDAEWFINDESSNGSYGIFHDGTLCGVVGIGEDLGYWLGVPFHGKGIMTEAAGGVVADYFDNGGEVLNSGYLLGNAASANVLTKLGFQPNGTRTDLSKPLAREVTLQKMVLTRDRWIARHET